MKISLNKRAVSYDLKFRDLGGSFWPKFFDKSAIVLVISNCIVILFALFEKINASEIIWLYWAQSVFIGIFAFLKIRSLKVFNTKNLYIKGKPAKPDEKTKQHLSWFFAFHYGLFHIAYLIFLIGVFRVSLFSLLFILAGVIIFFFNHYYSHSGMNIV